MRRQAQHRVALLDRRGSSAGNDGRFAPSFKQWHGKLRRQGRRGAATLDYALVLGVVMPMVALIVWLAPRIMTRVYEMSCTLVSWPFM